MNPEPGRSAGSSRLEGIEALRCVAAAMIVVYHTVELTGLAIPPALNVIKTHFGLGVPLFYALSGFVLAFGYLDTLQSREQIRKFYARRYFRIAPLFYVMLGTWVLFSRLRNESFVVGPFEFLLNVSLLFGLVPGRETSLVAAGWSIGVEVLFYLVFPVIAALLTSPFAAALAFCVFSVVSSLTFNALVSLKAGFFAYGNLLTHLPFFLCGTLAYLVWRRDGFRRRPLAGAVLLVGVLVVAAAEVYVPAVSIFLMTFNVVSAVRGVWALVFAALILAICYSPTRLIVNPVTRYLGTVSFSLYLLHPFVIALLLDAQRWIDRELGGGLPALAARLALIFSAVTAAASVTYAFIEKPGMNLGKRLTSPTSAFGSPVGAQGERGEVPQRTAP
jgi:peptidoglycan/LPS O-acetylase OafA/YrhL